MLNRRSFLSIVSNAPFFGMLLSAKAAFPELLGSDETNGQGSSKPARDIYAELGIPTFINAGEPFTIYSGAPLRPEVKQAMALAETPYVELSHVQDAVGTRISSLLKCEAAMVTAGAASGLTLGTAACMTKSDISKIKRIPDSAGMPNEVVIQKAHRYDYEHAVRACGVRMVEIETLDQLNQAINSNTACLLFNNRWNSRGQIQHEEFIAVGKQRGIPTFNDCASDVPPAENLTKYTAMGFDLVTFSGGKGLRGPSSTGLLTGRKDLIEAAKRNHEPFDNVIGRGMKINKEEMIGLLVAVEMCLQDNSLPLYEDSERKLHLIARKLSAIAGVTTEPFEPPVSYRSPHLRIRWNEAQKKLTAEQARMSLLLGKPAIMTRTGPDPVEGLEITAWMLRPEDVQVVVERITEILS